MFEEITNFEHLYESMNKCRKGVGWKDSTMSFTLNGIERTLNLEKKLNDGTYQPRPIKAFKITNPKPRDIISIAFVDRVYQRSLNDNALYPIMSKSFIYDNWACQKGKGTLGCRDRLKEFLHSFYRKHGTSGYCLQCDIRGYYPNMSHEATEALFREKLPPDIAEAAIAVLRGQYSGDKGYNPGSQMIQIAGISMLDKLDHYIKEQLHIRYYLRYMDDFILVHEDKAYLEMCRQKIREQLATISFELNEDKTRVFPLTNGIMFLGFNFALKGTGKVVVSIDPKRVKAERKKLYRLVAKSKRGEMPKSSVDDSYQSWREYASYGNSYRLITRMDKYYYGLWRGDNVQNQNRDQGTAQNRTVGGPAGRGEPAQRRP